MRRLTFTALAALAVIVFLEVSSYVLLSVAGLVVDEPILRTSAIYREQSRLIEVALAGAANSRDVADPVLGWRYRAGFRQDGEQINRQGVRSRRTYSPGPAKDVLRVAVFGDSFVYGSESRNEHTWSHFVEQVAPRIELLNYGVGGYGTDQALLRYRSEGAALQSQVAILSFTPVDMRRNVSVYRRFIDVRESLAVKPRFILTGEKGSMKYLAPPLARLDDWRPILKAPWRIREWGRNDHFYEPLIYENPLYDLSAFVRLASQLWFRLRRRLFDADRVYTGTDFNTAAEAFRIQLEIYRAFLAETRRKGHSPVLLMLPGRFGVEQALNGKPTMLETLTKAVKTEIGPNITVLDASNVFREAARTSDIESLFAPGGHYSEQGNRIVGAWLALRLQAQFPSSRQQ